VDTQTRHALKKDKFVTATTSGLDWVGENRNRVVLWSTVVVLAIAAVVAGIVVIHQRDAAARRLLGQAMDIYETPLAQPNQPAEPGMKTYATAAERAKAAYPLFSEAANRYSWSEAGEMARYFAGVTALDLGEQAPAEADLEKATHAGSSNLEALAKVALANLYEQTGRSSQAVTLLQSLIQHPTTTVPKAEAQLQLAAIYETTQPDEARRLYAEIKDQNKDTDAAQVASQKLAALK
jgi:tetratricopeptide (TPR) repeat protein